ncbi:FHA domain-containing protein [Glaciihabitans sp. dw_435]|uniref:FHA domain-containing protein n=1 Tax=Glaciihabitans sp. dw_435 TaxID=2720081 RepID=UPI001BD25731|nr:FHA domain-containing protein [Glaciihabitans sp. dw_435]
MISYVPAAGGDFLLVATENRVLFFRAPATTTTGSISDVWDALGADDPVQSVLGRLTSAGLESTPHFALAIWSPVDSSVQVLVRGDLLVDVESTRVSNRIDARGVSTWRETTIEAATGLVVTTSETASAAGTALPLRAGAVWASSATASFDASLPAPAISEVRAAPVAPASAATTSAAQTPAAPAVTPPPAAAPVPAATFSDASDVVEETSMRITLPPVGERPTDPAGADAADADDAAGADADAAAAPDDQPGEPADPEGTAEPDDDIEHLLDATIVRSTDSVPSRPVAEPATDVLPVVDAETAEPEGDHDGFTIMSADLAALRSAKGAGSGTATGGGADDAPRVPEQATLYLESASGTREPLTQPVLIGRAPSVSKVSSGQVPRLLTIAGNQDISRSHAQIALEGDTVVVTDLHSRNGTSIVLPGKSPQLLRQGEPTAILVGTVIDLGGGISFTLRHDA